MHIVARFTLHMCRYKNLMRQSSQLWFCFVLFHHDVFFSLFHAYIQALTLHAHTQAFPFPLHAHTHAHL